MDYFLNRVKRVGAILGLTASLSLAYTPPAASEVGRITKGKLILGVENIIFEELKENITAFLYRGGDFSKFTFANSEANYLLARAILYGFHPPIGPVEAIAMGVGLGTTAKDLLDVINNKPFLMYKSEEPAPLNPLFSFINEKLHQIFPFKVGGIKIEEGNLEETISFSGESTDCMPSNSSEDLLYNPLLIYDPTFSPSFPIMPVYITTPVLGR